MSKPNPFGPDMKIGQYMDTAPFWAATRVQRLLVQFCTQSKRWQAYPRPGSISTGRRQLEWREANGKGVLTSWTVDRMSPVTAGAGPRIQALVDLVEGVRLLTWLVECDSARLRTGMPLQVAWRLLEEGWQWPAFAPLACEIDGAPG
jgi:uncharacterized protein